MRDTRMLLAGLVSVIFAFALILPASVQGSSPGPAGSPWPRFAQNPQSTSSSPYPGIEVPESSRTFTTDDDIRYSQAVGADGAVHAGSFDGSLHAISQGEPVTFPDPNLEAVIREAINKPAGDIYKGDLQELTSILAPEREISNLAGLEHVSNLAVLNLARNRVSDISPANNLTSLIELDLSWNQITVISPLADLTGLAELDLSRNKISDISPLADLSDLKHLHLGRNKLSDLAPLADLTGLTWLNLWWNELTDISPLTGLTNLIWLDLSLNGISDAEPLVDNPGLGPGDTVNLSYNPLSAESLSIHLPALGARGVVIIYEYEPPRPSICFIATAAYGTPMAEEIQVLREFRDKCLLTNRPGKGLVELYYTISPPIAEFIDGHPGLKPMVRAGLWPAVMISRIALTITHPGKAAIVTLVALVWLAFSALAIRRRLRPRAT